jgi:hypothetical protein
MSTLKLSRVRFRFGFAGSIALGLALGSPALVGQTTWGGTGSTTSTGAWSTATNWSNGVPGMSTAVVFDGQGATTITGASGQVAGMTFSAGSYTITTSGKGLAPKAITVAAGTQTFNGSAFSLSSSTWSVAAGAALNVSSNISLSPGNGALTLDGAGNFDLSSNITESPSGTATFTKNGSGTAILRGATNTTNIPMIVNAGTLLINGTFSSATGAMTVNGGTLGGTGSMRKNTAINAGGRLAPGAAGVGALAFGGTLTLATGSTTAFELNGTTRGTDYDGLNITGLTTFGGTLELDFGSTFADGTILDLFALGGVQAGSFDFITGTGSYAGSFTNDGGLWTMVSGGQLLSFSESTGDLTFSAASVPEPATSVALAGAAALAIVAWRRGRGRRASRDEAGKRS